MKRLFLFLLFLGLVGPPVWAAGTCTVTDVTSSQNASSRVPDAATVVVTLACTADASAATFPSTTIPLTGSSPSGGVLNAYNLTGYFLYQVAQKPGGTAPTANYTVTITDARGFALDLGLLTSNGSATVPQLTAITNSTTSYPVVRSALTVAITGNAVNSAVITLDLVFRANSALAAQGASSGNAVFADGTKQSSAAYNTQAVTISPTCPTGSTTCVQIYGDTQMINTGTSNSTTTVTCTGCFATSDVGKVFWATTNAKSGLYETVVCPQTTIASVTNSNTAVLNSACTANASANAIFVWGHDDGATLAAAFQDCRSVKIGAASSTYIMTSKGFANTSLTCNNSVLTGVMGAPRASLIGEGYLGSQTTFIMTPSFDWTTCTGTANAEGKTYCFGRQLRSIANIQVYGSGLTPAANANCANAATHAVLGNSGSGNMGGVDIAGVCAGTAGLEGIVIAGQDNTLSEGGAQDVGQWACVFSQFDGESGFGNDCHNNEAGAGNYGLRVTGGAKVFQYANTPIEATLIDGNSTLMSERTTFTAPTGASQAVSVTSGSSFYSYNDSIAGNGNTGLLNAGYSYMNATPHTGTPPLSNSGTLFTTASTYTGSPNITAGTVTSGGGNTFASGTLTVSSGATHYGLNDTFNAVTVNSGGKLNITNTAITGAFSNAGTVISGGQNKLSAIPSGAGAWNGLGVISAACRGTATSSSTLGLFGGGQYTTTACTSTTVAAPATPLVQQVPLSGSVFGLSCTATHAGVNASSGVVTVLKNGSATTLTCTIGTATSCTDFTHFDVPTIGDGYSFQFTTQGSEVLAGVACTVLNW